jgi:hypothetical protein
MKRGNSLKSVKERLFFNWNKNPNPVRYCDESPLLQFEQKAHPVRHCEEFSFASI